MNAQLEVPAIDSSDWEYPWYVIKHEDGKFENTKDDSISAQDTIHLIHNSKCFTYRIKNGKKDEEPCTQLPICEAKLSHDTLLISTYDFSASNAEAVYISVYGDQYLMTYKVNYVVPYQKIEVENINQRLVLNQSSFKKGQVLKGEVYLEIKETMTYESGKKSAFNKLIEGTFEVKIN